MKNNSNIQSYPTFKQKIKVIHNITLIQLNVKSLIKNRGSPNSSIQKKNNIYYD